MVDSRAGNYGEGVLISLCTAPGGGLPVVLAPGLGAWTLVARAIRGICTVGSHFASCGLIANFMVVCSILESTWEEIKVCMTHNRDRFMALLGELFPSKETIIDRLKLSAMIIVGGLIIAPLLNLLPVLGHDWLLFFNGTDPDWSILNPASPFLPYTRYLLMPLTWMNWRVSFAIMNGITVMAIALGVRRNGGSYLSIIFALLNPIPWMLMWVGHPDGLALAGMLVGFIPLTLIKPQLTIFSALQSRKLLFWTLSLILVVLVIWPYWPSSVFHNTLVRHEAAFGWPVLGWPVMVLGLVMLAGAGRDPWLLMSAGCLVTPDLLPYHLVVLLPIFGRMGHYKQVLLWFTTFLLLLGLGYGGQVRYLNLAFPVIAYLFAHRWQDYKTNLKLLVDAVKTYLRASRNLVQGKAVVE